MSAVVLPAAISHFTSTQVIFSNSTRSVCAHGARWAVCASASDAVIPSAANPATPTITLHTDLFIATSLDGQNGGAGGGARFQGLVRVSGILERKALIDLNAHLSRGHHIEQ